MHMKVNELLESDDSEGLKKFRKTLVGKVQAAVATNRALSTAHKWKYEVGDIFLSAKTKKTYEITGRSFVKRWDRDENYRRVGDPYMGATYSYKTNDGEKGMFYEKELAASKDMKKIASAPKN
jgi:hypothetical protein